MQSRRTATFAWSNYRRRIICWLCRLKEIFQGGSPYEIRQRREHSPGRPGKGAAVIHTGRIYLRSQESGQKGLGRGNRLPAGAEMPQSEDCGGVPQRRVCGGPGRAVLSLGACHTENHISEINAEAAGEAAFCRYEHLAPVV